MLLQRAWRGLHAVAPLSSTRWDAWLPSSRPAAAVRAALASRPQRALRNLQTLALLDTLVRPTWTIAGKAGAAAAGTPAAVSLAQGEGPVLPGLALQPGPPWGRLIGLALVAACLEPSAGRGRAGLWKAGVALHTGTTHYCALWRPLHSFRRNNQAWTLRFSGLGWFTCNADRCRPILCPPLPPWPQARTILRRLRWMMRLQGMRTPMRFVLGLPSLGAALPALSWLPTGCTFKAGL